MGESGEDMLQPERQSDDATTRMLLSSLVSSRPRLSILAPLFPSCCSKQLQASCYFSCLGLHRITQIDLFVLGAIYAMAIRDTEHTREIG
mmetsp:Transcript_6231/g.24299  ORF Transcript_6231/g.24299 Transcript_6231/m.24299 type:complete len:90 (-) Transcript_6231:1676-1945(-)